MKREDVQYLLVFVTRILTRIIIPASPNPVDFCHPVLMCLPKMLEKSFYNLVILVKCRLNCVSSGGNHDIMTKRTSSIRIVFIQVTIESNYEGSWNELSRF